MEGVKGQRYLVRRLRFSSCHVEGQHFGGEVGVVGLAEQGEQVGLNRWEDCEVLPKTCGKVGWVGLLGGLQGLGGIGWAGFIG